MMSVVVQVCVKLLTSQARAESVVISVQEAVKDLGEGFDVVFEDIGCIRFRVCSR